MTVGKLYLALAAMAAGLFLGGTTQADPWIKAESAHFIVYSDNSEPITRASIVHLEQYRYVLSAFYGRTADTELPQAKLRVYFLSTFDDLKQTWPDVSQDILGYFKDCVEGQEAFALFEGDSGERKLNSGYAENMSQIVLFHEYAHNFMFSVNALKYPTWFVEGFAEYYDTIRLNDTQAVVGLPWTARYNDLTSDDVVQIPYDRILHDIPPRNGMDEELFYAQSWLLGHWIISSPDREKMFVKYITDINQGQDPVTAFEADFNVKVAALPKLLRSYMEKEMPITTYNIKAMPKIDVSVTAMPESAHKLLLWDAADRICPGEKDGATLLQHIQDEAARYPNDDFAQMALLRADIIIGDESKALDPLLAYTGAHPDDAEARFRLGQVWYLMTIHKHYASGETAESQMRKARAAFGRSYQLDPLNPSNLYYYALAHSDMDDFPDENAVTAAVEARNLAPAVEDFAIYAARLLILKDRPEEAKPMLFPAANNPHNTKEAKWASDIIAAIDRHAPKAELLNLLETHKPDKDGQ